MGIKRSDSDNSTDEKRVLIVPNWFVGIHWFLYGISMIILDSVIFVGVVIAIDEWFHWYFLFHGCIWKHNQFIICNAILCFFAILYDWGKSRWFTKDNWPCVRRYIAIACLEGYTMVLLHRIHYKLGKLCMNHYYFTIPVWRSAMWVNARFLLIVILTLIGCISSLDAMMHHQCRSRYASLAYNDS